MPLGANSRMNASPTSFGMDLAVDVRLAHAARDQLRDLRAEVEDQDLVVHGRWLRLRVGDGCAAGRRAWRDGSERSASSIAVTCSAAQKKNGAPMRQSPCGRCDTSAEQRRADHRREHRHQAVQRRHRAHRLALASSARPRWRRCSGSAAATVKPSTLQRRSPRTSSSPRWPAPQQQVGQRRRRPARSRASRCGVKRLSRWRSSTPCTSADITPTANSDQPFSRRPPAELEGACTAPRSCTA